MPWLGRSLASLESLDAALIVGGNLRFEQPLLSHRLRKAALDNGAAISSIAHFGGRANFPLHAELTGSAETQYAKWRSLLRQIYASETGLIQATN